MEIELVPAIGMPSLSYWYLLRNDMYRVTHMFARVYKQYRVECIVIGTESMIGMWLFNGGFTYLLNLRAC